MSIQFDFTAVPFGGYYMSWGFDGNPKVRYHKFSIKGAVLFHMENNVVVEDYVTLFEPINPKSMDKWNTLAFEDVPEGTKIPVHKSLRVKSISKEQFFIGCRKDEDGPAQWLFLHKDLVGLTSKTLVKKTLRKPPFEINQLNFELVQEVQTSLGTFVDHIKYDWNDFQVIKYAYRTATTSKDDDTIATIETQIKMLENEIKDLQACMERWDKSTPEECLQKPVISWTEKGGEN